MACYHTQAVVLNLDDVIMSPHREVVGMTRVRRKADVALSNAGQTVHPRRRAYRRGLDEAGLRREGTISKMALPSRWRRVFRVFDAHENRVDEGCSGLSGCGDMRQF